MCTPVLSFYRKWTGRATPSDEASAQWARASVDRRGPETLKSMIGLCNLLKNASACQKALKAGACRREHGSFVFARNHPLIHDLKTYFEFISEHHPTQV